MNNEDNVSQPLQNILTNTIQANNDSIQTQEQNTSQPKSPLVYLPFLLLLLILLGGIFYYGIQSQKNTSQTSTTSEDNKINQSQPYTATSQETINKWKTFIDPQKRFTFAYPDSWTERKTPYSTAGELTIYQAAFVNEKNTDPYSKGVIVGIYPGLGNLTLEEFLKTKWYTSQEFTPDVAAAFISNIRIAAATKDIPFEQCEELYLKNGIAGYAVWKSMGNDGIFIIARNMSYSSFDSQGDDFRQIITSFKIL